MTKQDYFREWQRRATKGDTFARERAGLYQTRPAEELYDVVKDPYQMHNLAADPAYRKVLDRMRPKLDAWMASQGDLGAQTELDATQHLLNNRKENPKRKTINDLSTNLFRMKKTLSIAILAAASLFATARAAAPAPQNTLRAPAYPLITIDPYTSCWSAGDYLYDSHTTHWTGQPFPLVGALRVDGKTYRFMGIDAPTCAFEAGFSGERSLSTPAVQQSADVRAMQTVYEFTCGPVGLTLTFTAPLFLDDLELISRPVNYIAYETRSLDGAAHNVQIYFEASPACAVNTADQEAVSDGYRKDGLAFVRTGSKEQNVLRRKGDQIKIDWGYFYLCAPRRRFVAVGGRCHDDAQGLRRKRPARRQNGRRRQCLYRRRPQSGTRRSGQRPDHGRIRRHPVDPVLQDRPAPLLEPPGRQHDRTAVRAGGRRLSGSEREMPGVRPRTDGDGDPRRRTEIRRTLRPRLPAGHRRSQTCGVPPTAT